MLQVLADGVDGALFQPAYLRLRDAHLCGDLHLGLALIKAQRQDTALPRIQTLQGILQGDALGPALICAFG